MDRITEQPVGWVETYGDGRAVTCGLCPQGSMVKMGRFQIPGDARGIYQRGGRSPMSGLIRDEIGKSRGWQGMSRDTLLPGPRSSSRYRQYGAGPMDQEGERLEGIRRVINYLPFFEEEGNVFGTWKKPRSEPGVVKFDWFDMSEPARAWFHTVYESGLMLQGFDWGKWQNEAQLYVHDPSLLETADLDTLRKLLVIHLRKERFCEGHLENMYECGHLTALMKRLKQIADQMEGQS